MKLLSKYEYCRRHLLSGKTLTYRQAVSNWQFYSFRIFLGREKKRSDGLDIINLNEGTGKFGKYKLRS
jgi:hypothetical protein